MDWRGNSVLVNYYVDKGPHEITLDPGVEGSERLSNRLADEDHEAGYDGIHKMALDALDYHWIRIGDLGNAINRGQTEHPHHHRPGP